MSFGYAPLTTVAALVGLIVLDSCSSRFSGATEASIERQVEVKGNATTDGGQILRLRHTFRLDRPNVILPVSFATIGPDQLLMSDNNAQAIFAVDDGEGGLVSLPLDPSGSPIAWPNRIRSAKDELHVMDLKGLRIFDLKWKQKAVMNSFHQLTDFVVTPEKRVIAVPTFRTVNGRNPLIVVLSMEGRVLKSLGSSSENPLFGQLLNRGFVDHSDGRIAFASKFEPRLRTWTPDAHSDLDLAIEHPVFEQLKALDEDVSYSMPDASMRHLSSYLAGVVASEKSIYIALDLPFVEVRQYDWSGVEVAKYVWVPDRPIARYFGMEVNEEAGTITVGITTSTSDPSDSSLIVLSGV